MFSIAFAIVCDLASGKTNTESLIFFLILKHHHLVFNLHINFHSLSFSYMILLASVLLCVKLYKFLIEMVVQFEECLLEEFYKQRVLFDDTFPYLTNFRALVV